MNRDTYTYSCLQATVHIYLLTYLLTYCLSAYQKYPAFFMEPEFITVFTKAHHWTLSWASWIHLQATVHMYEKKNEFYRICFQSLDTNRLCSSAEVLNKIDKKVKICNISNSITICP